MRFKSYLTNMILSEASNSLKNSTDIIYQEVLDNLDDGYIEYENGKAEFHIGRLIKKSDVDIHFLIRETGKNAVRNAKKGEDHYIVVDVKTLPERDEIDSFLENPKVARVVKEKLTKCLQMPRNGAKVKTKYEEDADDKSDVSFKNLYNKIESIVKKKYRDFLAIKEDLETELDTENAGKRATTQLAIKKVFKEYLGEDSDDFVKIVFSELKDSVSKLDKDQKDKIESRLESFYDQKIKPIKLG